MESSLHKFLAATDESGVVVVIEVTTPILREWQSGGKTKRELGEPSYSLRGGAEVARVGNNEFVVVATGRKVRTPAWTGDCKPFDALEVPPSL